MEQNLIDGLLITCEVLMVVGAVVVAILLLKRANEGDTTMEQNEQKRVKTKDQLAKMSNCIEDMREWMTDIGKCQHDILRRIMDLNHQIKKPEITEFETDRYNVIQDAIKELDGIISDVGANTQDRIIAVNRKMELRNELNEINRKLKDAQ